MCAYIFLSVSQKGLYTSYNFRLTLPRSVLETYYVPIMQALLTRLEKNKTEAFSARFVRLYHFVSAKGDQGLGTDFFIKIIDQVQTG